MKSLASSNLRSLASKDRGGDGDADAKIKPDKNDRGDEELLVLRNDACINATSICHEPTDGSSMNSMEIGHGGTKFIKMKLEWTVERHRDEERGQAGPS